MALIIAHRFPLGRFHATRWKQNPFGDPYDEWPPSPWRLLRTLAARWFQYARETGDVDEQQRDLLLQKLALSLPTFVLPHLTWRGPAIKQYQPTGVDWTDKSKAAAGYKKPQTTLVEDHYRVLPPDEPLYWVWGQLDLDDSHLELLDHLLERTLYFGRAESFCHLRRVEHLPVGTHPNCCLTERGTEAMPPVLVPIPGIHCRLTRCWRQLTIKSTSEGGRCHQERPGTMPNCLRDQPSLHRSCTAAAILRDCIACSLPLAGASIRRYAAGSRSRNDSAGA